MCESKLRLLPGNLLRSARARVLRSLSCAVPLALACVLRHVLRTYEAGKKKWGRIKKAGFLFWFASPHCPNSCLFLVSQTGSSQCFFFREFHRSRLQLYSSWCRKLDCTIFIRRQNYSRWIILRRGIRLNIEFMNYLCVQRLRATLWINEVHVSANWLCSLFSSSFV